MSHYRSEHNNNTMLNTFHWLDYLIFVLVLVLSLLVGVYFAYRSRNDDNEEFLRGSRDLTCIPVSMSLVVTYFSAIGVQGESPSFGNTLQTR